MNIEAFAEVTNTRIPTPAEFVSFAYEQGWTFVVDGDKASLRVQDASDPMVKAFAKMLSREPYRTNVIAVLNDMPTTTETVTQDEPDGIVCRECKGTWYCDEAEIGEHMRACHMLCDKPRCPYRGGR